MELSLAFLRFSLFMLGTYNIVLTHFFTHCGVVVASRLRGRHQRATEAPAPSLRSLKLTEA